MTFHLHLGDCIEVMRGMADASVDSIVTDPPYELGFMGKGWDSTGIANNPAMWAEALRVLKPGGHLLAFSGSRTYHRMACAIEDAGFELRDQIMWIYGSGFPKSRNLDGDWEGWGTALKPAHEPICVARKPLAGTVAANVQAHGAGALNIDACRVAADEVLRAGSGGIPCRHDENTPRGRSGEASADVRYNDAGGTNFAMKPGPRGGDAAGRWPANVIHDGSDEVLAAFAQFGERKSGGAVKGTEPSHTGGDGTNCYGEYGRVAFTPHTDAGSAARFFYCAKASRADRNEGCDALPDRDGGMNSNTSGQHITRRDGWTPDSVKNNHPTVKPTDLMAYLCRLVTPPGGLVLDPFMGSGSTGKAAMREGFRFIGIDMTPEYVEIARARIAHELASMQMAVIEAARQPDLFGEAA